MAEDKKRVTVILVPANGAKTYTFQVRRGLLYGIGVICLLFVLLFAYMAIVHQSVLSRAMRAGRLEMENSVLRLQAQKIAQLEGELTRLQSIRRRLYEMAGMPMESTQDAGDVALAQGSVFLSEDETYLPSAGTSTVVMAGTTLTDTTSASGDGAYMPSLWPVRGWVTAEFNEQIPGREKRHQGMDIAAAQDTPILSAASGQVAFAGWDKNLGLVVIVDHQNGLSTLYGHCSRVIVVLGEEVNQGQVIAHLGNTGRSSAPHLHLEIRENGIPVDPRSYLGP